MKNIKEYVTIHIVNRQISEGKKTEFTGECEFYEKDNSFFITYLEPSEKARFFIKIQNSGVTVRRMGEVRSVMEFETGKTTNASIQAPFGKMGIMIKTSRIENGISENGGELLLKYALLAGGEDMEREVRLEIKKEK